MNRRVACAALVGVLGLVLIDCDRRVEPFDPSERVEQPDLSKIFPEGAARAQRALPGLPLAPNAAAQRESVAASGPPLSGTVRLAPELASEMPPRAVLFIVARTEGGGPPLAVKRVMNPTFPLEFTLGPEDRMIQARPFTGPLQLTARVDRDGNATSREPGDLHGGADGSFEPGDHDVEILIDAVL